MEDYRDTLLAEFESRRIGKPEYSFRAFAEFLGLSPAHLSSVVNGKRQLSLNAAARVAERLGYDGEELAGFLRSLSAASSKKTPGFQASAPMDSEQVRVLTPPEFESISDWYYFGILAALDIPAFDASVPGAAASFEITRQQADEALMRLKRLGFARESAGRIVRSERVIKTTNERSDEALRKFHRQMIERALVSLERDGIHERDITGITLAIDRRNLPRIKEEIRAFRRRLLAKYGSKNANAVYQVNCQAFPLSARLKSEDSHDQ